MHQVTIVFFSSIYLARFPFDFKNTQGMRVLSLSKPNRFLKLTILLKSSYLLHLLYMTQLFHRYIQRPFGVDCTAGHQIGPVHVHKYHKLLRNLCQLSH